MVEHEDLATRQGWVATTTGSRRPRPENMSLRRYEGLSDDERVAFNDARLRYHGDFPTIWTSEVKATVHKAVVLAKINRAQPTGARTGIYIGGPGASGKTAILLAIARRYHKQQALGTDPLERDAEGRLFTPSAYYALPKLGTAVGQVDQAIARFMKTPSATFQKTSSEDIAAQARTAVFAQRTTMLLVDDVHRAQSNALVEHIKHTATALPVTPILAGVDVSGTTRLYRDSQTASRFHRIELRPHPRADGEWLAAVRAIERHLFLLRSREDDLSRLAGTLHGLAQGRLGALVYIARIAAGFAIESGEERITKNLLADLPIANTMLEDVA